MKLTSRSTINYLIYTFGIFLAGAFVFFINIHSIINQDIENRLQLRRKNIEILLQEDHSLHSVPGEIELIHSPGFNTTYYADTLLSYQQGEPEEFLALVFPAAINGENYKIILYNSMTSSHHLFWAVGILMILLFLLIETGMVVIHNVVNSGVWAPFFRNINALKKYQPLKGIQLKLEKTRTDEFNQLNDAIHLMAAQIESDFRKMKEFSEDIAHETQTPVAIVKSKLEVLISKGGFNEEQAKLLNDAYQSTQKLAKLNQSLLLLTRLETPEYQVSSPIHLNRILSEIVGNFEDIIEASGLELTRNIEDDIMLSIHPILADVLFTNLLRNSIRHNQTNGRINIVLSSNSFVIENTGLPLSVPTNKLFDRFKKQNIQSESLGLGLAIVKKICDYYSMDISYTYKNELHIIKINFRKN